MQERETARAGRGKVKATALPSLTVVALVAASLAIPLPSAAQAPPACGPAEMMHGFEEELEIPTHIVYPVSPLMDQTVPSPGALHGWSDGDLRITSSVPLTIDGGLVTGGSGGSITIVAPSVTVEDGGFIATRSGWDASEMENRTSSTPSGGVTIITKSLGLAPDVCITTGRGGKGITVYDGVETSQSQPLPVPVPPDDPIVIPPERPRVGGHGAPSGGITLHTNTDLILEGTVVTGAGGAGGSVWVDFNPDWTYDPEFVVQAGHGAEAGPIRVLARNLTVVGTVETGPGGPGGDLNTMGILTNPTQPDFLSGDGGAVGELSLAASGWLNVTTGTITTGEGGLGGAILGEGLANGLVGGTGGAAGEVALSSPLVLSTGTISTGTGGDGGAVVGGFVANRLSGGPAGPAGSTIIDASTILLGGSVNTASGGNGGDATSIVTEIEGPVDVKRVSAAAGAGGKGGDVVIAPMGAFSLMFDGPVNMGGGGTGGASLLDYTLGPGAHLLSMGGPGGNGGKLIGPVGTAEAVNEDVVIGAGGAGGSSTALTTTVGMVLPPLPPGVVPVSYPGKDGDPGKPGIDQPQGWNAVGPGPRGGDGCPAGGGGSGYAVASHGATGGDGDDGEDGENGTGPFIGGGDGGIGGKGGNGGMGGNAYGRGGDGGHCDTNVFSNPGSAMCVNPEAACWGGRGGWGFAIGGNGGRNGEPGNGGGGGNACPAAPDGPGSGGVPGVNGASGSGGHADGHGGEGGLGDPNGNPGEGQSSPGWQPNTLSYVPQQGANGSVDVLLCPLL